MGNHYTGGIGYADDLTLLTPTRSRLKILIDIICEQYADNYHIMFNGAKSMYLVFRGRSCTLDNRTVVFNGTELQNMNNMHEDVSALDIGRTWQMGMTNERISDVSVLSDMIEIRNGLKT